MKIGVIGTGYVGLVTGACLSEFGHEVTCLDIDTRKIASLNEKKIPIYEPGLSDLVLKNAHKNLFFTSDYSALKDIKALFLAVGTPSREDGTADLSYLFDSIDKSIEVIQNNGTLFILKSTVPIGTHQKVSDYIAKKMKYQFYVVNNPEFLKEGSAVNDFMRPDRVVIGSSSEEAFRMMSEIYAPFVRQGNPILKMSNVSAEMTKYAANGFLAVKISFINEISRLCEATGANIEEVRSGIASDTRIGKQFLYPGPGYGGSCFPKDVKALLSTGQTLQQELKIISAAEQVNQAQKNFIAQKMKMILDNNLKGKKILVWGLAFKANTDDVRESPAIDILKQLEMEGSQIVAFDPMGVDNFKATYGASSIEYIDDKYAVDSVDALLILTEWKEFQNPDFTKLKTILSRSSSSILFDARNILSRPEVERAEICYFGVGR